MLNYHFWKLGEENWKAMAEGGSGEKNPYYEKAMARFLTPYGLPEFFMQRVHQGAACEFMRAMKKRRVPSWVLLIAPYDEIQQVAKEAEGVRR